MKFLRVKNRELQKPLRMALNAFKKQIVNLRHKKICLTFIK